MSRHAEFNDEIFAGQTWIETREAPDPPVEYFIDVDGITQYKGKTLEHAEKLLSCARTNFPGKKCALRIYNPNNEEYEQDCQRMRDALRWSRGHGGPAEPWPMKNSVKLEIPVQFRAKLPENASYFAKKLKEAMTK